MNSNEIRNHNIVQNPLLIQNGFGSNLLHPKPLSKYLDEGTSHIALSLDRFLDRKFAHMHVRSPLKFFQKAFTRTIHAIGGALTGTVAAVEIVASTALAAVAVTAAVITKGKYSKLNKFASKVVAYDAECFFRLVISIQKIFYKNFPKAHTEIAVQSELVHLIAAVAGLTLNVALHSFHRSEDYVPAYIALGIEGLLGALPHIVRSIFADIGGRQAVMNQIGNLQQLSPQNRQVLLDAFRDLNFRNLANPTYVQRLIERLSPVVNELLQNQNLNMETDNSLRIQLSGNYNNYIYQCTKDAYNRITASDEYAKCLSPNNDANEGRDNLASFDAAATIPLAGIAQLIEIEKIANGEEIQCSPGLIDRYNLVKAVSEKMQILNDDEKRELHKKILKSSDYVHASTIRNKELFDEIAREIGILSSTLYQGTLFQSLEYDQVNGAQRLNHFTKAWQDAASEAT